MAKQSRTSLTPRDLEILEFLDRTPLTAAQLTKVSIAFNRPFPNEDRARSRLRRLAEGGFAKSYRYSLVSDGRSPSYWKPTATGFRAIVGGNTKLPARRYFAPISPAKHIHSNAISEVITHIVACGARHGIMMRSYARENSVRISANGFEICPDGAFQLFKEQSDVRGYSFFLELDNGTERIQTKQDIESIERKIQGYDAYLQQFKGNATIRPLTLFITTRGISRLDNVLNHCASLTANPDRTTFLGATLAEFLKSDPFESPTLRSNNGLKRTITPLDWLGNGRT